MFNFQVSRKGIARKSYNRSFREEFKNTLLYAVQYWHEKILPRHFYVSAHGKYRHQRRDAEWVQNKRKKGRGQGKFIDLLFKGTARRWLTHNPQYSATSRLGKVKMEAPPYFVKPNEKNPGSQPDKVAELKLITRDERQEMAKRIHKHLIRQIKQAEKKR
ncbi:hypothetical protein [Polystyrenella longa]|uniref:hypothetical protein n=1 Tax=Polystyrenella longa TaxID=2528007 RepID=UPI0011AB1A2C|nr:hypothetical protein [Polystyrenella longa]